MSVALEKAELTKEIDKLTNRLIDIEGRLQGIVSDTEEYQRSALLLERSINDAIRRERYLRGLDVITLEAYASNLFNLRKQQIKIKDVKQQIAKNIHEEEQLRVESKVFQSYLHQYQGRLAAYGQVVPIHGGQGCCARAD